MGSDSKIKAIGARKASEPISISSLIAAAEKVILTDRNAMLKAQNSVSDLATSARDGSIEPRLSSIGHLCGKSGAVKLLSSSGEDSSSEKVVDLGSLRRKS